MEKVVIDFSPLKSGGGVQLAYNFLDQLENLDTSDLALYLLVPQGRFNEYRNHPKFVAVIDAPLNILKRNIFERTTFQKFLRANNINKIFTFFGSGLPHPAKVKSIVGVAYPIICYDESDFWKYLPVKAKLKQKIINSFRKKRLRKANLIFAETSIMKMRLEKNLGFSSDKIQLISPSPSNYIVPNEKLNSSGRYIFLSGLAPHKNLWRLYEVAQHLKQMHCKVKLVVTANKQQWQASLRIEKIDESLVNEYFDFLEVVPQKEITNVYKNAEALVLLSDLESFSNNHMEAWKAGVPQIVSKRDFMTSICKDSALFCEPHEPRSVAYAIEKMHKDEQLREFLVNEGKKLLQLLPSQEQRTSNLLELIRRA